MSEACSTNGKEKFKIKKRLVEKRARLRELRRVWRTWDDEF
jgi:hypothetical protein